MARMTTPGQTAVDAAAALAAEAAKIETGLQGNTACPTQTDLCANTAGTVAPAQAGVQNAATAVGTGLDRPDAQNGLDNYATTAGGAAIPDGSSADLKDDSVAAAPPPKKKGFFSSKLGQGLIIATAILVVGMLMATPFIVRQVEYDKQDGYDITSVNDYGPVMVKTLDALRFTATEPGIGNGLGQREALVPYGDGATATVRRDGLNSLFVSFKASNGTSNTTKDDLAAQWGSNTTIVPWMATFMPTAAAPTELVTAFAGLVGSGGNITGPLTTAIDTVMGKERVLWLTCTGDGPGGGLAVLCGVAGALGFPATSVDVITFGTPWAGFNSQFAWSFDRLVHLYLLWPFDVTAVPAPPRNLTGLTLEDARNLAEPLKDRIDDKGTLREALSLPNLPPALPEGSEITELTEAPGKYEERVGACYDSYVGSIYGNTSICAAGSPRVPTWGQWGPGLYTPPSACPPITCRARAYLDASCTGFGDAGGNAAAYGTEPPPALRGLPTVALENKRSGGDALVAWNATSKEAIFLFKYTNETRDWVADALAYKIDDFRKLLDKRFPPSEDIIDQFGDPQVHAGFYRQFRTLLDGADKDGVPGLEAALYQLSGGVDPLFISISGFSLGGAVGELAAVWAAHRWPQAHVYVATQGAPKVGNDDYVIMYRSSVGTAHRFQFNMDEVPAVPPLIGYRTTRAPIWVLPAGTGDAANPSTAPLVLLGPRPDVSTKLTTWYDHWCEVFYVPIVQGVDSVAVPGWIMNYQG